MKIFSLEFEITMIEICEFERLQIIKTIFQ